ncbi:hypothetical protein BJ684DRAFT_4914, partial [Piptocephalis cylindrospora]
DTRSSLWMGEIEAPLDETFLTTLIPTLVTGPVRVKMIRDRNTGNLANYCFLDFRDHATAEAALTSLNGTLIPNAGGKIFRLNWANGGSGGGGGGGSGGGGGEYSVFVGDLGPEVTEEMLLGFFVQYFGSVKGVKLLMDPATGQSKGYGFVRFYDESDQQRALSEMPGQYCGSRAIRVSTATPRQKPGFVGGGGPGAAGGQAWGAGAGAGVQGQMGANQGIDPTGASDPKQTTLFVGNIYGVDGEDQLRSHFAPYGEIVSIKLLPERAIAFVEYANRTQAEQAMAALNGSQIGSQSIRLSWGRGSNGPAIGSP